MNTNNNNESLFITGKLPEGIAFRNSFGGFLSLFGITPESRAEIEQTTAQEDLIAEQNSSEDMFRIPASTLSKIEKEEISLGDLPKVADILSIGRPGAMNFIENLEQLGEVTAAARAGDTPSLYDVTRSTCPDRSTTSKRLTLADSLKIVREGVDDTLKPATIEASKQTMKTLHLVTLVLKRIGHFHTLKLNFSAHDITRSVRDVLAAKEYDLAENCERDFFNGDFLPVVRHADVKSIVHELFEEDLIPDYTPDLNPNRPYILYVHKDNDANATATATNTFGIKRDSDDVATDTVVAVQGALGATQRLRDEMFDKIRNYVDAKIKAGETPSMKQIQSRMKGFPVTCTEIYDWAVLRGYTIETEGKFGAISKAVIIK